MNAYQRSLSFKELFQIEEITKIGINDEEAKADPRLARLMRHRQDREDDSSSDEEDGPRRRRRHEAEILEDAKESSGDESEDG